MRRKRKRENRKKMKRGFRNHKPRPAGQCPVSIHRLTGEVRQWKTKLMTRNVTPFTRKAALVGTAIGFTAGLVDGLNTFWSRRHPETRDSVLRHIVPAASSGTLLGLSSGLLWPVAVPAVTGIYAACKLGRLVDAKK